MKLTEELKSTIDFFFENRTSEELIELSKKYGLEPDVCLDSENKLVEYVVGCDFDGPIIQTHTICDEQ